MYKQFARHYCRILLVIFALLGTSTGLYGADLPTANARAAIIKSDQSTFILRDNHRTLAEIQLVGFDHNWRWLGAGKSEEATNNSGFHYRYGAPDLPFYWDLKLATQNKTITLDTSVSGLKDQQLQYLGLAINFKQSTQQGYLLLTDSSNKMIRVDMPIKRKSLIGIKAIKAFDESKQILFTLDLHQPANLHLDGNVRIKLAEQHLAANQQSANRLTFQLQNPVTFYSKLSSVPNTQSFSDWFAFNPLNLSGPGEFGMYDWLTPTSQTITSKKDELIKDGQPFRVWGTNVEYSATAPSHSEAAARAEFFAKYGINGVRLHKLTNPGWEGLGSDISAAIYDPAKLERFDYFTWQLAQNGITYGLSPIWDLKIFEGDRKHLRFYDEVKKLGDTTGLVWFAEDIQDLHIKTLTNLLNHKNTYSDVRYAEDPGVTYIEIQNESDVFFYTTLAKLRQAPNYQKLLAQQFSDWLKSKYSSHTGLVKAWGSPAINAFRNEGGLSDEHLDKRNIVPVGNPWFWDKQLNDRRRGARLKDSAEFLYLKQNEYYQRAVNAIRATGFSGEIVTSNWQAGSGSAHFLNLMSDAKFGMIDRHNYMGGASGNTAWELRPGFDLNNITMLFDPGSGMLSSGMQQVSNRPFLLSEWLSIPPSEWAAADTVIIAAYGLGLQGWDMSYHFASNGQGFTPTLQFPGTKKFNNLTPVGVGLNPVLSRMVIRGDVRPGEIIATRRVSFSQAKNGDIDFENQTLQAHDIKSFTGTPHHNALAAGKVLIEFVDQPTPSTIKPWQQYRQGNTIASTTGQLKWTANKTENIGYIEINTSGTQGFAGINPAEVLRFDDVTITPQSEYSVILTTAKSRQSNLAEDNKILLVAMARAYNSGMNLDTDIVLDVGTGPIILEPVRAQLQFKRQEGVVHVLDHDGLKTGQSYRLEKGLFNLDTGRDETPYYMIEFE